MELVEEIVAMQEELALWRKDIHAHPELGFEENRTADFVAQKLEEFGILVIEVSVKRVWSGFSESEMKPAR